LNFDPIITPLRAEVLCATRPDRIVGMPTLMGLAWAREIIGNPSALAPETAAVALTRARREARAGWPVLLLGMLFICLLPSLLRWAAGAPGALPGQRERRSPHSREYAWHNRPTQTFLRTR
jgi:hypothetical protein